jgi:hypothetical protein
MGIVAPPYTTSVKQPQATAVPSIAPAKPTLASLTATVNQLRQTIQTITGQNGVAGQNKPTSQNQTNNQTQPGGSFNLLSVTHATRRIFLNNDPSAGFIDVPYIAQLVMQNNATSSKWTYNEPATPSSATPAGGSFGAG